METAASIRPITVVAMRMKLELRLYEAHAYCRESAFSRELGFKTSFALTYTADIGDETTSDSEDRLLADQSELGEGVN